MQSALKGRRILLVRNDRIGDLVLALPLLRALKAAGAFVGVLATPYTADLLKADARCGALVLDGPGVTDSLLELNFDTALVLWANARNARLVRDAGIPRRLGPSLRPYSWLFTERLPLRRGRGGLHETELNFEYGRALGLEGPAPAPSLGLAPEALREARAWLKKRGPKGAGPLVLLHPGSGGSAQPWPAERFAALGLDLAGRFGARLVVTGGPGDSVAVEACAERLGSGAVRCVELSLAPFAALLGLADLFVAGSTGPLHLAAAQGTPVLGLYPPLRAMSPLRWGPRGSRRAVLSPAGLGFRIPPTPGANFLERISVDEAVAASAFLLEAP
ncbi:MAG TPA: glycosyltransferase family 9 protein [bacterium]|jgi:ADP-heptose:LPS heptosyltransferase|nr:glycosyltransferase family 9 protein [bacterium]